MYRYFDLRARAGRFAAVACAAGPVLILAPSLAAADEVAREACGSALWNVYRFGFRDFASELAADELLRRQLVPVSRFVREALAARITADALARDELSYLEPVARFPGFPRALTQTIEELRLQTVETARLRRCGRSGPDLALLLDAYERELETRQFADYASRVSLAIDTIASGACRYSGMALAAIDLPLRTRLERDLYEGLIGISRERLELQLTTLTQPAASSRLESLQKYLFSNADAPVRVADGSVEIFSTSGEALECTEIARQIGRSAESGVPFDQIGVLLRLPERHQPLIAEALRRAGIPYFCAHGSMRPDPAGRSFLALLQCAEERYSASRFAEYLSLGQMPDQEEAMTPALWERLLVDASVVGGAERWKTRLSGLREELRAQYERRQEEEETRDALRRRISAVENLAEMALPVIERLETLPQSAMWGEWIDALTALAEATLRNPGRVVELVEELQPMAEIGPVRLAEVLLTLGPRLGALPAGEEGSRYGRVWIGGIEAARGLAFRHVFVPGVNEGLFPCPPAEDPLLLEAQRKELDIPTPNDDAELLEIAVATPSERLWISFSRLDLLTGRERVPSFYAFAAHRAAGGEEIDVREFELRARSATQTRIGWPAPPDAADAIDDPEFDLATLAPLAPGSGQYLKGLPGRAVASLRARWVRWHKGWKAADGLIIDEIGSQALVAHRLTARAWSPSVLQQYARCPYRFALRGIYGLEPRQTAAGIQRIDLATRGRIYHEVQFELLRELAANGLLPIDEAHLAVALDRLDNVLQRVAERVKAGLAPAIPQIWRSGVEAIRADLRGWLQQRAEREADWTPEYFELSFGLPDPMGHDARSRKAPVAIGSEGFLLRGSIDLIDRHRSGVLRVVDHKTGRIPDPRPVSVGGGETLQPVLYGLAAEQILGERVAMGRLSYATIAQNYEVVETPLNDWMRQRGEQVLRVIDGAIRDGFLPAAPRKDGCRRCEYLPVCGPYEEERVLEKSAVELKGLKELRKWH
jgi:CRISPR/Cas system-associated exonuclease Cas4 (RecB family)